MLAVTRMLFKFHSRSRLSAMFVVLMIFGLCLRLVAIGRQGLFKDEIFSASYTNLSLFETVVASLRYDVHPPTYYLQLNLWSAFGHSDNWLMLNSVIWGMVTLVLVFISVKRRADICAGLIALALCAVLGSEIYFANELRMYTMFSALVVLSWMVADQYRLDYKLKSGIALASLLIIIGTLHSYGVIAVSAVLLYTFPIGHRREFRVALPKWLAMAMPVGVCLLPWMINAATRHVAHLDGFSYPELVHTISGWILGYGWVLPGWLQSLTAAVVVLLLAMTLYRVASIRKTIACFILWPLFMTALICILWKPIWLFRPFAFCSPFIAICLGLLCKEAKTVHRGSKVLGVTALLGIGWMAYRQAVVPWKTEYREAATYLKNHVQTGEVIYIPDHLAFWGLVRYLVGPSWGNLLDIGDPVNQDHSAVWPGIYRRLGTVNLERLHLVPKTRRLDLVKGPIFIGWSPLPEAQTAGVLWLVGPDIGSTDFVLSQVAHCKVARSKTTLFMAVRIERITCEPTA